MNPSIPGANSQVNAAVADGSGNLYIGGNFSVVGDTLANRIAKWNGTRWTGLGSGMNNAVRALAISGNDLYAGGDSRRRGAARPIASRSGMGTVGQR